MPRNKSSAPLDPISPKITLVRISADRDLDPLYIDLARRLERDYGQESQGKRFTATERPALDLNQDLAAAESLFNVVEAVPGSTQSLLQDKDAFEKTALSQLCAFF